MDDRLGRNAGNGGASDVMETNDEIPQLPGNRPCLCLEHARPCGVVWDNLYSCGQQVLRGRGVCQAA